MIKKLCLPIALIMSVACAVSTLAQISGPWDLRMYAADEALQAGDYQRAEVQAKAALTFAEKVFGPNDVRVGISLVWLVNAVVNLAQLLTGSNQIIVTSQQPLKKVALQHITGFTPRFVFEQYESRNRGTVANCHFIKVGERRTT